MKKYIYKENEVINEYKYVFLCGTHYDRKNVVDKRNILSDFLSKRNEIYRPIILEEHFLFKAGNSRYLGYDAIHMKDLHQVEILISNFVDKNIIIHESITTGAEIGMLLSEERAAEKTCLLVPDQMAVEENKLTKFIQLAFMKSPNKPTVHTYYPRIEKLIISDNVKRWHTYFTGDNIGNNLSKKIMDFMEKNDTKFLIRFTRNSQKIKEGYVHFSVAKEHLDITMLPRSILCCIATIFNISDLEKRIFNAGKKELKEYIKVIKESLMDIFINSIQEKTGKEIKTCSIIPEISIKKIYIGQIIGMCLYLFQAADFIKIVKAEDDSNKVEISRKMLVYPDGTNHFFYEKYKSCIDIVVDTQIK